MLTDKIEELTDHSPRTKLLQEPMPQPPDLQMKSFSFITTH